jgi:hypothetical protein
LKNPSLFLVLLAVIFVGATSCGDDQKAKDAEIAALRQQLALQASGQGKTTVRTITSTGGTTSTSTGSRSSTGTAARE